MRCARCGSPQERGSRYCTVCGSGLPGLSPQSCEVCGRPAAGDQRFCSGCGSRLGGAPGLEEPPTPFEAPGPTPETARELDAERRFLTVMYVDLVGSTQLATQLDPEDFHDLMLRYHSAVGELIRARNGAVAKFLGDGIFAFFGFPRAHEDDAEQAVRAGLDVVGTVRGLHLEGGSVDVRVGIATGLVVVGESVGETGAKEYGVFGETPNLVARLQEVAPPGRVVLCPTTARLVAGHFACSEPAFHALKGFVAPVAARVVEGDREVVGRFEAQHLAGAAPILGRSEELDLLRRRWDLAAEGQGRVVVLSGEAGIGKSRVVQGLRELLRDERYFEVRLDGSPHNVDSALFPFVAYLERTAGFKRDDGTSERVAKLSALVDCHDGLEPATFALIAQLLSLPVAEIAGVTDAPAHERRARTFEALFALCERCTRKAPLLLVVEDAHWMDPTSLELLALIVERADRMRALVVVTARQEFAPPWPAHPHVASLTLARLDREHGAMLTAHVAGRPLPADVLESILARTDGVPIFVEELTKTVLESGVLVERDGRWVIDRPVGDLAIPETLQASLFARLDRLKTAREVAQIAAAIGREFAYDLLEPVAAMPRARLVAALDELVGAELVFRRGEIPHATFAFKHALVRDAAYAGLLKSRRRALHGAIARQLRERFPETVARRPELLAHHLSEASDGRAAGEYWLLAGRGAGARSAHREAIAHLRRGLEALPAVAEGRERNQRELDLLFALGPCLIATEGPAAVDAVDAFERARELCARLDTPPQTQQVMFWIATASVIRGELVKADEAVAALLEVTQAADGDRPALLNALRGRAMIKLFMGELDDARETIERFLELFDASTSDQQQAARAAGQDARAAGLALLSWTLWLLGERTEAFDASTRAIERAAATGHPHTQAYVAYYAAVLHALDGAYDVARAHAAHGLELSNAGGFAQWRGLCRVVLAICRLQLDAAATEGALGEIEAALGAYRSAGYQLGLTALYTVLCPALVAAGHPARAAEFVEDGLAIAAQTDERLFEAALCGTKASILGAGPTPRREEAMAWRDRSVAIARAQRAHALLAS